MAAAACDKTKRILDEAPFEAPFPESPWKYILMKSKLSGLEGGREKEEGGRWRRWWLMGGCALNIQWRRDRCSLVQLHALHLNDWPGIKGLRRDVAGPEDSRQDRSSAVVGLSSWKIINANIRQPEISQRWSYQGENSTAMGPLRHTDFAEVNHNLWYRYFCFIPVISNLYGEIIR